MNNAMLLLSNPSVWLPPVVLLGIGISRGIPKKKAENFATHEDIDTLVKMVEATTESVCEAESIRCRITGNTEVSTSVVDFRAMHSSSKSLS